MNIVFNKCIFFYLCLFYSSTKYFHEFQSIFINFRFTDIFVKISIDISVKSKYRYIRNYRYFVPWIKRYFFLLMFQPLEMIFFSYIKTIKYMEYYNYVLLCQISYFKASI